MVSNTARLLLVDDDWELSSLMSEFLSGEGFAVQTAADGPTGLRDALSNKPDLMVLDVMMPGFDGFELLRRLRAESRLPVIMLTARTESESRIAGLNSGADDYLPKPFEPLELVARIRAVLRRTQGPADHEPLTVSTVRLEPGSRRVFCAGIPVEITTIEYDILEVLMRSAGKVVSRDDLMLRLYGRESTPFDRSVDVHISHLRRKLNGRDDLIRTIRGIGYQFASDTSGSPN